MKKNLKIPAVLALLFISIFAQAAGYYFSRSFSVLSLSLLSFIISFEVLLYFTKTQESKFSEFYMRDLKKAGLKSSVLNAGAVIFFSLLVLSKLFKVLQDAHSFDAATAQYFVLTALFVFILCSRLVFGNKTLFRIFLFSSISALLAEFCIFAVSKSGIFSLDIYASFFLISTVLVLSVLSIIKSIKAVKN
ncbi:MAG: hypothetical protein LBH29_01040 [Elusimicrobiota bacterium]|jgi:hypothetical protein|nr:hypothetical protein [Elusimicrobiota bacterium]